MKYLAIVVFVQVFIIFYIDMLGYFWVGWLTSTAWAFWATNHSSDAEIHDIRCKAKQPPH